MILSLPCSGDEWAAAVFSEVCCLIVSIRPLSSFSSASYTRSPAIIHILCIDTKIMVSYHRATKRHLPYGITQCYLTPDAAIMCPTLTP